MIERAAPGQASIPRVRRATRAASIATTLRRSLVDHGVTPAEGARLERQCDDALAALLEVREHAREAQRVSVARIGRRA